MQQEQKFIFEHQIITVYESAIIKNVFFISVDLQYLPQLIDSIFYHKGKIIFGTKIDQKMIIHVKMNSDKKIISICDFITDGFPF
jgi:hypothetical protein